MLSTAARLSLVFLLAFAACDADPASPGASQGAPPPPPPATAVSFACGSDVALTFDLPCQVGLPLGGTLSAVECTAHVAGRTGIVTLLIDLGAQRKFDLLDVHTPQFGDIGELRVVKGALLFSQVDVVKRTFTGRLQDVSVTLERVGTCQLKEGPLSGVAGNFL